MAHSDFAGDSGYDPNEIMTRSQDANGHSSNTRFHIPPVWRAQMEQYVQSEQWPEYKSIQHIFRDALYHRLHWISEQKDRTQYPGVRSLMLQERYRKRLEADIEQERTTREFRNQLDVTLNEMLQREEYDVVQSYCEDLLADIDAFPGREQEKLINQLHTYLERAKGRW